jgi:hypothetical protein
MTKFRTKSPSEAAIQRRILKYLNDRPRCWAAKFPGVLQRGVPDIIGVYRGAFFALEIKRPDQKPTPLQRAVMEQIRDAGGRAEIAHGPDDIREILLEIDEELALQRFGE